MTVGKPAMFCDHANECPVTCPCAPDCYCRSHTCRSESAAELRRRLGWPELSGEEKARNLRRNLEALMSIYHLRSDPDAEDRPDHA